jgi:hypothetical protein
MIFNESVKLQSIGEFIQACWVQTRPEAHRLGSQNKTGRLCLSIFSS